MLRIGVDVGGTNTDAALLRGSQVLATIKTGTTADVTAGVAAAIRAVLAAGGAKAADVGGEGIAVPRHAGNLAGQAGDGFVDRPQTTQVGQGVVQVGDCRARR